MAWLKRRLGAARAWKLAGVAGSIILGVVVLWISFCVSYGAIWYVSHALLPLPRHVMLLIAGGFMVVVIIVGARQNWESIEPMQKQMRLAREMGIGLTPLTRGGISANTDVMSAEVFWVRGTAAAANWVLCGGVLLLLGAWAHLKQFRRLGRIDADGCARVIGLLQTVARRQSFAELVQRLPGLDPVTVFDDLHKIEGVLFLSTEPAGLTLHPDLKSELVDFARQAHP